MTDGTDGPICCSDQPIGRPTNRPTTNTATKGPNNPKAYVRQRLSFRLIWRIKSKQEESQMALGWGWGCNKIMDRDCLLTKLTKNTARRQRWKEPYIESACDGMKYLVQKIQGANCQSRGGGRVI